MGARSRAAAAALSQQVLTEVVGASDWTASGTPPFFEIFQAGLTKKGL